MITYEDCSNSREPSVKNFFSNKDAIGFYEWGDSSAEKGLERLVFQVSRKPNCLEAHLDRIYYCFQNNFNEQLFGALVDLLIVLNKNGQALGKRMVMGARAKLTALQFHQLNDLLVNSPSDINMMTGNGYSVFSKGLQSAAILLHLNDDSAEKEYDPLVLARDYIEFSQLDDAVALLEEAVLAQPERIDLHQELLSLYRSTRNASGFNRMYRALSNKNLTLPPEWKQLDGFLLR